MPSVRGWERAKVIAALAASSVGSAALAGFGAGALWHAAGLRSSESPRVLVAVTLGAVLLDAARVPPIAVNRQVPQMWGRIFSAPVAAALYGARLGVGPLTILTTWLWWAAVLIGASAGVVPSVVAGVVFALGRVAVMLAAGPRAARLRRTGRAAAVVASLAAVTTAALAAPPPSQPNFVAPGRRDAPGATKFVGEAVDESGPAPAATVVEPETELSGVLPIDLGAGFRRLPDDGRRLGRLDLAEAAAIEPDRAAEQSLLETRRFRTGHTRAWEAEDGQLAYAAIYEFASPPDAAAYLVDGFEHLEARGARSYAVDTVAGAKGFSDAGAGEDGSRVSHGVAFVRGSRFVLVVRAGQTSAHTPADAAELALRVENGLNRGMARADNS